MYWSLMNKEKIDRYQGEKIDSKIDKCMKNIYDYLPLNEIMKKTDMDR